MIALSSDGLTTLSQGKLAIVNNQVDQASGTIEYEGEFENGENALWPGLSVSTRLLINTLKHVIVVSDDAIQHGPAGLFAFVVGSESKVEMRAIKINQDDGANSVVSEGLQPGENVVTAGQYRLVAGSMVQAATALLATPAKQDKAR